MTRVVFKVVAMIAAGAGLSGCGYLSDWTGFSPRLPSLSGFTSQLATLPIVTGTDGRSGLPLELESEPAGAEVRLSTGGACRTPCSIPVPVTAGITATFSMPGYRSVSVAVQPVTADASVDREFASAYARLDPNPVFVALEPAAAAAPVAPPPKRSPTATRAQAGAAKPSTPPRTARPAPPPPEPPEPRSTPPTVTPATPLPPN